MTRRPSLLLSCLLLFLPAAHGAVARAQTDPPTIDETDPGSPDAKPDPADPGTVVQDEYGAIPADLPDSQSRELAWRLPPLVHSDAYYQAHYGFYPPLSPGDRLTTANRLKLFQYLTNGGQRAAALQTIGVPQLGSDLTFWWGLIEGMADPWTSVNCNKTHHDPERNCPVCVQWQVGYGAQAIQLPPRNCSVSILSDIVGATSAAYPGRSAQAIGSQVAWQAGSRWSFPNVSASTLRQLPDDVNGTCADPAGVTAPCNNRYWGSVLIRDPAVGAWLESAVTFPCYLPGAPGWCDYYKGYWQRNSDWLNKVINTWTDLRNAGRARTAGFLEQDTRLDGSGYDFDPYHTKASCWNGAAVLGISLQNGHGKTALCVGAEGTDGRFSGQLTSFHHVPGDDRTYRRTAYGLASDDWAFGYWKLECNADEYVSSVSQDATWTQGDDRFHGIGCARLATGWNPGRCNVRVFDAGDNRGDNPPMEDWDSGAFKGQCATNEYVAGISVNPGNGAPHSLLCCR